MSQDGDNLLLDLFREEVHNHTQVLSEGLVAQEHSGATPELLERLMRAAHSIKGAARVVNVQAGVDVAHAMEDCFVRAQQGQLTLTSAIVDLLLAAVDRLRRIGELTGPGLEAWQQASAAEIAALVAALQVVAREGKAPTAPAVHDATAATPGQGVAAVSSPIEPHATETAGPPLASDGVSMVRASSEQAAAPSLDVPQEALVGSPSAVGTAAEDSVVRVAAKSLTRLMGLAGESLVEARWLQPFAKSLLELKRRQSQLAETLEAIHDTVSSGDPAHRVAVLVEDARQRLDACRELLSDRIGEFDNRIRSTDDLSTRLYREVIASRMRPFRDGVQGLPRLVREVARELGKKAKLEIIGETTEVDRDVLEKLDAPLNHLVRNALDHGLESPEERRAAGKPEVSRLRIEAAHHAGMLSIVVSDDGRGIDLSRLRRQVVQRGLTTTEVAERLGEVELLDFLFLPGFSTSSTVTELSGRGVGLDIVQTMVRSIGGHARVHTRTGRGTTFQLELPVTLSVLRAVVVEIAGEPYALPHHRIDRVLRVPRDGVGSLENRQYLAVDGQNVGIVLARQVFQLESGEPTGDELLVVMFSERSASFGLVVDQMRGEHDLVVRPLDHRLGKVPNLHAAAILDDGSPVLIVDLDDLRRSIDKILRSSRLERADARVSHAEAQARKRILVVDDSITVREVERQLLANQGYLVETAVDGMEGWNLVREGRFDLVISDIDMPRWNGLELVRKIKADERLRSLPVVIVSYKDREEDRLRGMEVGANYYLTKSSFHDDTLIQAVRELIGDAVA